MRDPHRLVAVRLGYIRNFKAVARNQSVTGSAYCHPGPNMRDQIVEKPNGTQTHPRSPHRSAA
jgi:hypothetical protein